MIWLQDYSLADVEFARIAAASISSARAVLDITPLWPTRLQRLFWGLKAEDFETAFLPLITTFVHQDSKRPKDIEVWFLCAFIVSYTFYRF